MKKIIMQLCCTRNVILLFLSCFGLSSTTVNAQPQINQVTFAESVLELCASSCSTANITAIDILNTDMWDEDADGDGDVIKAIVWSGATSSNGNVLVQGLYVEGTNGHKVYASLPSGSTNPDVVIGRFSSNPDFRVAVVYENGSDIYLNVYDLTDWDNSSIALSQVGTAREVTDSRNDAHHPHIDMRPVNDETNYSTGGDHDMVDFGICWHQDVSPTEVWVVYGDISNILANYHTAATPVQVADGSFADIALGGTEPDIPMMLDGADYTFIVYIADNGDLAMDWSDDQFMNQTNAQLEVAADLDDLHYPRIEACLMREINDMDPALCHVVASMDMDGSPTLYKVKGYSYLQNTTVNEHELTDRDGNDFYQNSYNGLMPAICGLGRITDVSTPNQIGLPFATIYYSDYTYHNDQEPNDDMVFDGDFYGSTIQVGGGGIDPFHEEVNFYDLASSFSTSTLPVSAITSSSNSGYGTYAVWYDGEEVKTKLRTSAGAWKPGKPNSINHVSSTQYDVYPNPVINELMVTNITQASYNIVSLTGQTVLQGKLTTDDNTIRISHLAAGTYLMVLNDTHHTYNIKFVKQ